LQFPEPMCATQHPAPAKGVVLLDSLLPGGWRAGTLALVKLSPFNEADDVRKQSFDRDVETVVYDTAPHDLIRALRRRHLHQVAGRSHRRAPLDGLHLLPMKKPITTAAAVGASLRNLLG